MEGPIIEPWGTPEEDERDGGLNLETGDTNTMQSRDGYKYFSIQCRCYVF